MAINELLYDHQLAMLNAQRAQSLEDRDTYLDLVGYYAKRITAWRRANGLSETGWPRDERTDNAANPA